MNTWNGSPQRELATNTLSGMLGADHSASPTSITPPLRTTPSAPTSSAAGPPRKQHPGHHPPGQNQRQNHSWNHHRAKLDGKPQTRSLPLKRPAQLRAAPPGQEACHRTTFLPTATTSPTGLASVAMPRPPCDYSGSCCPNQVRGAGDEAGADPDGPDGESKTTDRESAALLHPRDACRSQGRA